MPEPNYRQLENKSRQQHYLSVLVERLAGKDPKAIAESLHMTEASVLRDLEYVRANWSRLFSPDGSTPHPKASEVSSFEGLKVETKCKECGARIAVGEDRLVVAVLEPAGYLVVDDVREFKGTARDVSGFREGNAIADVGGGYESLAGKTSASHYCFKCSVTLSEFRIANPAFDDDVDFGVWSHRATSPSRTVAQQTLACPMGTESRPTSQAVSQNEVPRQSGEHAQKKLLKDFLDHPDSASMRPEMRTAARMWVDGSNQNEIAKALAKSQPTVHRMLDGARRLAHAPRYSRYSLH